MQNQTNQNQNQNQAPITNPYGLNYRPIPPELYEQRVQQLRALATLNRARADQAANAFARRLSELAGLRTLNNNNLSNLSFQTASSNSSANSNDSSSSTAAATPKMNKTKNKTLSGSKRRKEHENEVEKQQEPNMKLRRTQNEKENHDSKNDTLQMSPIEKHNQTREENHGRVSDQRVLSALIEIDANQKKNLKQKKNKN